jgi:hypothetical protein
MQWFRDIMSPRPAAKKSDDSTPPAEDKPAPPVVVSDPPAAAPKPAPPIAPKPEPPAAPKPKTPAEAESPMSPAVWIDKPAQPAPAPPASAPEAAQVSEPLAPAPAPLAPAAAPPAVAASAPTAPAGAGPAIELAGTWAAANKEMWQFTPQNYAGRWEEFEGEGFDKFKLMASAEDATFTFEYGSLCSGTGQWLRDESGHLVGKACVSMSNGFAVHHVTEQKLKLHEDGVLQVTYTLASGLAKGVTVVEYIKRA